MGNLNNVKGCGTALITPFKSNGDLDFDAINRLVDRQLEEGINFLVPCGTTGESATLSLNEHLGVIDTVIKRVDRKVPVIGGAGGYNTIKTIEMAKEVEKLGVDGILSVTPYYNKPTQEGLYQHYRAIAEAIGIPIILYNVPGRTNCNLLPDTVIRLSEIVNIVALKAASGNIGQILELALKIPSDFMILSGDDVITLPIIALGGEGVISVVANQMPKEMVEFTHACLGGDLKRALSLQKRLYPLMCANFFETNPIPVKASMAMMGLIEENYRLPLVPMERANKEKLHNVMKKTGLI